MAEALVSTVLEQLSWNASREIVLLGLKDEVVRLQNHLVAINTTLADAPKFQFKDRAVKLWMDELRRVLYDMEDILDEWNTAIRKSEVEAGEAFRKVRFFMSSCLSCHGIFTRVNAARKMRKLNDRLVDMIARTKFGFPLSKDVERVDRRTTASFVDVTEVKGRKDDEKKIIGMLLGINNQQSHPHIISLVGMGGIGKTTLAQLVYDDEAVQVYFEIMIWVCASDFSDNGVVKAILERLTYKTSDLSGLEIMLKQIEEIIKGKKFFLVLDDLWKEDLGTFQVLVSCLRYGAIGSKILVTTRKESAAIAIRSDDIYKLGMLSTEDCWSIFSHVAFYGKTSRECERLQGVGRKIIEKCKGLPFVAKALGHLLHFETFEGWMRVLYNEIWELKEVQGVLLAPLQLEYCDMPAALKQCFEFCAIFPKDYTIEKQQLILLWMAQGYLENTGDLSLNEVGEQYFQYLVERSFFQDFTIDKTDGSIISCKMHDMLHYFAQSLTKYEFFSIEINDPEESRMDSFWKEVRHLTVVFQKPATFPDSLFRMKLLHSLSIESKGNLRIEAALPKLFNQLSYLRSLNLSHSGIRKIPSNINKLLHLRQLDLSLNRNLKKLPKAFCELYNLMILDVSYCDKLVLPCAIDHLVNLSHLHNFESNSPLPKRIGRLTCLEILDKFVVGQNGEVGNLEDLENLNSLRGRFCKTGWFCISGLENVADANDLKRAQLKKKTQLFTLKLDFGGRSAEWRKMHDEELIEALEAPPNLEGLWLFDCQATRIFPTWMISLSNLRTLRLTNCINCELLPPLGKLRFLEFLHLWGMPGVKEVGVEFLGIKTGKDVVAFPRLTKLYFVNMENWEGWIDDLRRDGDEDSTKPLIMPCLQHLCLSCCPKLEALPFYILQKTTLNKLDICSGCHILEKRYEKGIGKDWLKIFHIPNVNISCARF